MYTLTKTEQKYLDEFFKPAEPTTRWFGVCDCVMLHSITGFTKPSATVFADASYNLYGDTSTNKYTGTGPERMQFRSRQSCHGFMGTYGFSKDTIGIFTSLRTTEEKKKITEKWAKFILGEQSPWRSLPEFDKAYIGYINDIPSYIFLPITEDTPSQLLVNFLIATRAPHEKYDTKLQMWEAMVQAGLTELEAMFFAWHCPRKASSTGTDPSKWYVFRDVDYNLHSFLNTWASPVDFKKLLEAKPTLTNYKWRTNNTYRPCNTIWNAEKFNPIVLDLDSSERYTGVFTKAFIGEFTDELKFKNGEMKKFNEIISIVKERRAELYQ